MNLEETIANYQPSDVAVQIVRSTPLVLLVGVSGAGKDTVKKMLLQTGQYHDFVSYTTRQPRINDGVVEQDGVEYHFVTLERMQKLIENGEMIEAKIYSGNIYGTGIHDLEFAKREGKIAINDIEVQGVSEYKTISPEVKAIFLLPPSYEEWRRRLQKRYDGSTNVDNMPLRLAAAKNELQAAIASGYYMFIINDKLEDTLNKVSSVAHDTFDHDEQARGQQQARQLLADISTQLE